MTAERERVGPKRVGRPTLLGREELLGRALFCFWRNGYEGTSVSDLCRATGLRSGSLYNLFQSKFGLFEESLRHYQELSTFIPEELGRGAPPQQTFCRILRRACIEYTVPGRPTGCAVILSALVGSEGSSEARELTRELRRGCESEFRRHAEEHGHPLAEAAAKHVFSTLVALAIQARDGATRGELETLAEAACSLLDGPLNRTPTEGTDES